MIDLEHIDRVTEEAAAIMRSAARLAMLAVREPTPKERLLSPVEYLRKIRQQGDRTGIACADCPGRELLWQGDCVGTNRQARCGYCGRVYELPV